MKNHYTPFVFLLFIPVSFSNSVDASSRIVVKNPLPLVQNHPYLNLKKDYLSEIERHRVWLNLTNNEGLFKQLLIAYVEGATNNYDHNYDAISMGANKYADFYSINEDNKLAIQGRALPFLATDTVPLGYSTEIEGDLDISIDHADGILSNLDIYLEDKKMGIMHNLTKSPYTFSTEKGTFLDRFVIRYMSGGTLGRDEFASNSQNVTITSKNKVITLKSYKSALQQVSVYDISGKLIYNNANVKTFDLQISNIQSGSQVLIVKALLENGNKTAQKVLF